MSDLFHVIPVGRDPVFQLVFDDQNTKASHAGISHIFIFWPLPTMMKYITHFVVNTWDAVLPKHNYWKNKKKGESTKVRVSILLLTMKRNLTIYGSRRCDFVPLQKWLVKIKQEWEKKGWDTFWVGFPMTAEKTDLGRSSPAISVLQLLDNLSTTTAGFGTWTGIAELFKPKCKKQKKTQWRQQRRSRLIEQKKIKQNNERDDRWIRIRYSVVVFIYHFLFMSHLSTLIW